MRNVPASTNGFDSTLHHVSANGKPFSQKHGNSVATIAEYAMPYVMYENLRKIVDKKLSKGYMCLNPCQVLVLIDKAMQAGEELGACVFQLY